MLGDFGWDRGSTPTWCSDIPSFLHPGVGTRGTPQRGHKARRSILWRNVGGCPRASPAGWLQVHPLYKSARKNARENGAVIALDFNQF